MLQSQPCSLQHNPEQVQMPAKLFSSAQPDSFASKANTSQTEAQILVEEGTLVLPVQDKQSNPAIFGTPLPSSVAVFGTKESAPCEVPLCPTNCYQIHQAQSEEFHSSQDTYQSNSDEYDDHYGQEQDEETSKMPEDERRLTKGENGLIHHVWNQFGRRDHLPTLTSHKSYITQTQLTCLPQIECTVNQESYEHQTGQVWSSSKLQTPKVRRSLLRQVSNKTNDAPFPSNPTFLFSSSPRVLPTQGSLPLHSKVPPHHASVQIKSVVNNTVPSITPHQAAGPALQSNMETHQHSSSVSKQVGRPMLVGVPLMEGLLDHHSASNLQTRPETLSVHAISDSPGLFQADILENLPGKVGNQKKAGESVLSMQSPNKKQKPGADSLDQSIDQINDVTIVSGVDLKEEEAQLLIEPAEKSHTSDELKRFVEEEELKLFLESKPLRQKILGIANNYGIRIVSEDVDRCLSLAIEEWYRSILFKLIRISKLRCDLEKGQQKHVVTSNICQQIMMLKKMAKDAQDSVGQKQEDNFEKQSEGQDKHIEDKLELPPKRQKLHEDGDKVRIDATNVAVRRAVGGDDMLLRWESIAAEGRLKRAAETGGSDGVATDRASKSHGVGHSRELKSIYTNDNADAGLMTTRRKLNLGVPMVTADTGRPPGTLAKSFTRQPSRIAGLITLKDMIAVLEMDPHMAKSTLLYRLYNRNFAASPSCQNYDSG